VQSKVTELVKDSTDDLWFLDSTTDNDDDNNDVDKEISDGNVFDNELQLVSDADDVVADSDSDSVSILPDEVSFVCNSAAATFSFFGSVRAVCLANYCYLFSLFIYLYYLLFILIIMVSYCHLSVCLSVRLCHCEHCR